MPNPESTFTQYLIRKQPKEVYSWKIMNSMQNGVPDCYFSGSKRDIWIEVKWVKLPKRDTTLIDVGLSELQKRWLAGRFKEGRKVAVVVGSSQGCCILRGVRMFEKISKTDLYLPKASVAEWITTLTHG